MFYSKIESLLAGYVLVMSILFAGWAANLYKFCQCDFKPSYKAEVIRGAGVFIPPVGAVLSLVDIEDGP